MIYDEEHGVHCKVGDFIKIGGLKNRLNPHEYYTYGVVESVYPIPEWEGDDEIYVVRFTDGTTTHLDFAMTQQDIILARSQNE